MTFGVRSSIWLCVVSLAACAGDPAAQDLGPEPTPDLASDLAPAVDMATVGITNAARAAAATTTAQQNAACSAIAPFYWEIGDQGAALASGSIVVSGAPTYTADTAIAIASASKWLYSTYWVQRTAGVLSASDILFFNFWSGYNDFSGCGNSSTVGSCLDKVNPNGKTNGTLEPSTQNKFKYGGGHMQKHAAMNGLADMDNATLATEIRSQLGSDVGLTYNEPQLAGGAVLSAADYAKVLRKILSGTLVMRSVLGTHEVCTNPATCPTALATPAPPDEQWSYSIGHWVETDPVVGDGAFSSAGAFGFYPWIDKTKTYYGVLSRKAAPGSGFDSAACGRLIRKAWVTGVVE